MAKRGPRKKAQQVVEGRAGSPAGQGEAPPLDELAEAVASSEAEPGPEMSPEEIAELTPEQTAEMSEEGPMTASEVIRRTEGARGGGVIVANPTGILRQVFLGDPACPPEGRPGPDVCGAQVSFSYRPRKWRDAEALIVAGTGKNGEVLLDLELGDAGHTLRKAVPYGEGVGCWKFRE